MTADLTFDDLSARAATINSWLSAQKTSEISQQRHLDRSTPECAYWHLGYQQALTDAIALLKHASPAAGSAGKTN